MIDDVVSDTEDGMTKAIEGFQHDLAKIRTGRANLALLDGVKVEYYGTPTPINQVATLTVVDARLISVKPWEKSMIPVIEKAIQAAGLGINPVADAEQIRLPIPPLTKERRQELVKVVGRMTEEAKVRVRQVRRDGNDMLKDAEKEKEISEDDSKQGQKRIQDLTDKYVKQVDEIAAVKEKEILEI